MKKIILTVLLLISSLATAYVSFADNIPAQITKKYGGEPQHFGRICENKILKLDYNSEVDGPLYYIKADTFEEVAICGGACENPVHSGVVCNQYCNEQKLCTMMKGDIQPANNQAPQADQPEKTSLICNGKVKVLDYGAPHDAPVNYIEIATGKQIAECHGRGGCTMFGVAGPVNQDVLCKKLGVNPGEVLNTTQKICDGKIKIIWEATKESDNTMRYIRVSDEQEVAHCTFRTCIYTNCTNEKCKAGYHLSGPEFCEYVR